MHDACRDIGFLTIVNHPVPPAKIKEIFRQSQRFFALPLADKMKAYMGNSNLFRGYLPMDEPGKQKAYRGKAIEGFQPHLDPARMKARKPHKNEAFQASLELPADDPDVEAGKPLHGAQPVAGQPAGLPRGRARLSHDDDRVRGPRRLGVRARAGTADRTTSRSSTRSR